MEITAEEAGVLHQRLVGMPRPSRMTYSDWVDLSIRLQNEVYRSDPPAFSCNATCSWCNRYPTIPHQALNESRPAF